MTRTGQRAALGAALIAAFLAGHFTSGLAPERAPDSTVASAPAGAVTPSIPTPSAPTPAKSPIGPDRTQPSSPPIDLGNGSDCGLGGTCLDEKHLLIPLRG